MDKYTKIKYIGRGAFGLVYLYRRNSDGHSVIMKEIPVEEMSKEDRQSVINEVKVLSILDHPNVIAYHENFLQDQHMLIVMEYAEGGTLFHYLEERNKNLLPEQDVLRCFSQLLLALQYVHSKQIIHRDLKSHNVLLDRNKTTFKISDFGISKILMSKSRALTMVGTPHYISPELCEGKSYNQKSDVWALGCILYELLTLQIPFESDNLPSLVMKIMKGSYSPVSETYSKHLQQLLASMLHLDPNKRPTVNQIMAQPFMVAPRYHTYMSVDCLPSTKSLQKSDLANNFANMSVGAESASHPPPGTPQVWYLQQETSTPLSLPLLSDNCMIQQLSLGTSSIIGITDKADVIVWKLLPNETDASRDNVVPAEIKFGTDIVSGVIGDDFAFCLSATGVVYLLDKSSTKTKHKITEALFGLHIVDIACGPQYVLTVSEEGCIYGWSYGKTGFLKLPKIKHMKLPVRIEFPMNHRVTKVFCGADCAFAVTDEKILFACGSNRHNKLAVDADETKHTEEVSAFTMVRSRPLPHSQVKSVAVGSAHTAFLLEDGSVYTTGSNRYGQLGWGDPELSHTMPNKVIIRESQKATEIASGKFSTLVVLEDGSLYCFGKCPQLLGEKSSLGKIGGFLKDSKVIHVACRSTDCAIIST